MNLTLIEQAVFLYLLKIGRFKRLANGYQMQKIIGKLSAG